MRVGGDRPGPDRDDHLRSVESLLVLIREHVAATGEVPLYTVWDGEEASPPKGVINVGLDSLNRATFLLTERFCYRVTTNSG